MAWLMVAFVVAGVISAAFSSHPENGLGPIRNPLRIGGFTYVSKSLVYIVSPLLYGAAALSVFMRLRRTVGVERQQLKWLAYAAAAWASSIIVNVITLAIDNPLWFEWTAREFFTVAGEAVPVSIGIAILRYRLYDIDLLINRTLVYGTLTATLVVLYFGGIVVLQRVFVALTGEKSTLAVVASTLAIYVLFNPLRRRTQDFIDRHFYRRNYDARRTLEAFSMKLRNETSLEALKRDLGGVVIETMQPAHVSLWLRPNMYTASKVDRVD